MGHRGVQQYLRSPLRQIRAVAVVSQPLRFSTSLVSALASLVHASCNASPASLGTQAPIGDRKEMRSVLLELAGQGVSVFIGHILA